MALLNENRDREELTLSDVLENDADGESKLVKLPTFSIEPYPDSLAAYIVCEKSEKFKILHCSERMRIFVGYELGELEDKTLEVMTGDLTDHSLLLDTYACMCDKGSASTELIVYHKRNIPIIAEVRMQLLDGVDDYFGDHVQKDIHIVFEPKTILLSTSVGKVGRSISSTLSSIFSESSLHARNAARKSSSDDYYIEESSRDSRSGSDTTLTLCSDSESDKSDSTRETYSKKKRGASNREAAHSRSQSFIQRLRARSRKRIKKA